VVCREIGYEDYYAKYMEAIGRCSVRNQTDLEAYSACVEPILYDFEGCLERNTY
jgi:hypothetical protein